MDPTKRTLFNFGVHRKDKAEPNQTPSHEKSNTNDVDRIEVLENVMIHNNQDGTLRKVRPKIAATIMSTFN